jgi:hypothetical protein
VPSSLWFFLFLPFLHSFLLRGFPSFSCPSLLISPSFLPPPFHHSLLSHQLSFFFLSIIPCYLVKFPSSFFSSLLNVSRILLHHHFLRSFPTRRQHSFIFHFLVPRGFSLHMLSFVPLYLDVLSSSFLSLSQISRSFFMLSFFHLSLSSSSLPISQHFSPPPSFEIVCRLQKVFLPDIVM